MKLGMPTLIEAPSLEECFNIAAQLDLSFIELNMNMPAYHAHALDIERAQQLMGETGIGLTMHLDENLNPFDFNPLLRDAHTQTARQAIRAALALGAPLVNIHMSTGVYFTLPDRKAYLFAEHRDHYMEMARQFRAVCEAEIGGGALRVCVENCGEFPPYQTEALEMLLQSKSFGLTFDVGHDHPRRLDEPFILAHKEKLRHMHLHDALGSSNHLSLDEGELDWRGKLQLAQSQDCSVVLEIKTIDALSRSVARLRNR